MKPRVIPSLLLRNDGLVKTVRYEDARYIGDPINAVRIFNEKEVDEMTFLDISATTKSSGPNFELMERIASEAFMPFAYGGGITEIEQVRKLFTLGVEKIVMNTVLSHNPELVTQVAEVAGSSSVVVSIDVRKKLLSGYRTFVRSGQVNTGRHPVEVAQEMQERGAGEILLNSIDNEGAMEGYDLDLVELVSQAVDIPVIASGGAGRNEHFRQAVDRGASAVAAGSMFVYHGKLRAVLITYPDYDDLEDLFG
ncbi:MAG TPA: imidazole glycerol phosphate synthase subunit HisF [Gemmatimonadetes bacterium]|mgnify:FL=1|nr:imidazole glycerol phosphate synthase subunit HisF [Gemmatimonadota bacterium]HBV06665.1 imidazole glycerol phosphate synthase subunit HisF [Gemmatimonadota bacterium]